MKNEGWFLIAFILLAMILLVLIVRSETTEKFGELPANHILAISQLGDDVNDLDERTQTLEKKIAKQEKELSKSMNDVDAATTGIQMITS